ncbi:ankyrin repeat-containing protein BDA1-like [Quercus robur]|uniref:ankyrin repeat-containing protein BDA1-like n=1 Tax=Quercus robur TaxID=38942 RepID=UPI0021612781|nr:ankyrin repeat-containing protein BDA1-like [Quercus robur]
MIQGGDDIVDLYNASAIGCTTTLKSLIEKDPRILHKISLKTFTETPLHISALLGHLDFTKTLLTQNPCLVVELDSHKRCPLHLVSSEGHEGHVEIVQELLTIYEDACLFHDQNGRIPLHYVAMRGRVEVVEKLIVARPDSVRVVLDGNKTVLHLCVKYNQLKALNLLVKSLSDDGDFLNFKTSGDGNTILHLAVMQKQIEVASLAGGVWSHSGNVTFYTGHYIKVDAGTSVIALKTLENCPKDFNNFTIRNILLDAGARVERVTNPSESAKTTQSGKKWWKNLSKHLKYGALKMMENCPKDFNNFAIRNMLLDGMTLHLSVMCSTRGLFRGEND